MIESLDSQRATLDVASQRREARRERLRAFFPLESGPQEIRSLDGLRGLAAILVVLYHAFATSEAAFFIGSLYIYPLWTYGRTGVQLFFVLSGFLLFMPYARAMLLGRPLPSARDFYQRRILRIVPAYWVCLTILVLIDLPAYLNATGAADFVTHLLFIHNLFPDFDSSINGPFWTMAVEAQFYLLLPGISWLIARLVRATGSLRRLLLGVALMIAAAIVARELSAVVAEHFSAFHGLQLQIATDAVLVVNGAEGRFLETFGVGMFCATLYVARREGRLRLSARSAHIGCWLFGIAALVAAFILALRVADRHSLFGNACYACLRTRDLEAIFGPLMLGIAYGFLLLAILLSVGGLRRLFSFTPLRFVGLVSYSLYLWHLPLMYAAGPFITTLPVAFHLAAYIGVAALAVGVAYISYQLIERPFLKRRRARPATGATVALAPTVVG